MNAGNGGFLLSPSLTIYPPISSPSLCLKSWLDDCCPTTDPNTPPPSPTTAIRFLDFTIAAPDIIFSVPNTCIFCSKSFVIDKLVDIICPCWHNQINAMTILVIRLCNNVYSWCSAISAALWLLWNCENFHHFTADLNERGFFYTICSKFLEE